MLTLGPDEQIVPLVVPPTRILVTDLLP